MRILLVTPAPPRSRKGNRITAERWARRLGELGHRATIAESYIGQPCDLLVALHARKSYPSIRRYRRRFPTAPLIVTLTGTDLYHDLPRSSRARWSLIAATRLIVLHNSGVGDLPAPLRNKTHVVLQSALPPRRKPKPRDDVFEVCVLGHLRPVKDPFRAALAARRLPAESKIRILHLGAALSAAMERRARAEMKRNPRYEWLGDLAHAAAMRVLARCRLMVVSSKLEGGPNVVCEALAADVPVVSSRISGVIGMLGPDYPGYFPVGDTQALAKLLRQTETDEKLCRRLHEQCRQRANQFTPDHERESWRRLLDGLVEGGGA